jgi:membrane protein implicated in regulation of membrane protease activity
MHQLLQRFLISSAAAGLLLLYTAPADAYIGPGAGLSLLGALWALLVAVAAALAFLVLWPFRQAMKRRAAQKRAAIGVSPATADRTAAYETVSEVRHTTPEAPTH